MKFNGIELFLDDEMVCYTRNIRRVLQQPEKHPDNPLIRRKYPWENSHIALYGSIIHDADRGVFRMWYNSFGEKYFGQQFMSYAESEDGVRWTKPMLDVCAWPEYERTNLLMGLECNLHGPCVIENPNRDDGERRYLLLFDSYPEYRENAAELGIHGRCCYSATSPDGLHWSPSKGKLAFEGKADSGQCVIWEPNTQMFRAYVRLTAADAYGQRLRIWRLLESPDFEQWGEAREIMRMDEQDGAPDTQLQQLAMTRYEGVYIGLLSYFRASQYLEIEGNGINEGPQINDTQLLFSRDGLRFDRVADRAVFLQPAEGGQWGFRGYRIASSMLLHDDRVLIYCDGYVDDPKLGAGMEAGLMTLPRDRFVAMCHRRIRDEALIELMPVTWPDEPLRLNASTTEAGCIRAEIADFGGYTVKGFSKDDAVAVSGDSLDHPLQWKADGKAVGLEALPAELKGKPVRLRLWSCQGFIYALRAGT